MNSLTLEQHEELNEAVNFLTAWNSWGEMRRFLEIHENYVPSIYGTGGSRKRAKMVKILQNYMRERGWKFFDGKEVVG